MTNPFEQEAKETIELFIARLHAKYSSDDEVGTYHIALVAIDDEIRKFFAEILSAAFKRGEKAGAEKVVRAVEKVIPNASLRDDGMDELYGWNYRRSEILAAARAAAGEGKSEK